MQAITCVLCVCTSEQTQANVPASKVDEVLRKAMHNLSQMCYKWRCVIKAAGEKANAVIIARLNAAPNDVDNVQCAREALTTAFQEVCMHSSLSTSTHTCELRACMQMCVECDRLPES